MRTPIIMSLLCSVLSLLGLAAAQSNRDSEVVGLSPWGPADEIGMLNMMTAESRAAVLSRIDAIGPPATRADPAVVWWSITRQSCRGMASLTAISTQTCSRTGNGDRSPE
jgi:hypothetical protein